MTHKERMELIHAVGRIIFSIALIIIGLIFSSGADATLQKVGIGFIASVGGYWVR